MQYSEYSYEMSFQIRKLGLDQGFKSSELLLGLEILIQSSFPDLKYYIVY